MDLLSLVNRGAPQPWSEGDNIPWNDPAFSERMLKEHLSQDHDAASRRAEIIDRHARFIHEHLLGGKPARVLDLACGPGLYAARLSRLGHAVRGVDFSPASIAYARAAAEEEQLSCRFDLSDLRAADFRAGLAPGEGYDLVMLIYGEFNVFCHADAWAIVSRAWAALRPGGTLLLEPHDEATVRGMGAEPSEWSASLAGLFSDRPHLLLTEAAWDEPARAATHRYTVIDAATAEATTCGASYQAYSDDEYRALLAEAGFHNIRFLPSLAGGGESTPGGLFLLLAERPEAAA